MSERFRGHGAEFTTSAGACQIAWSVQDLRTALSSALYARCFRHTLPTIKESAVHSTERGELLGAPLG